MTSIDAQAAAALVSDAVNEAGARGISISVAVVDDAASLVAFQRMGPAPRFSADFAIAKARTAATFSVPTSSLEELYSRPARLRPQLRRAGQLLPRPRRDSDLSQR